MIDYRFIIYIWLMVSAGWLHRTRGSYLIRTGMMSVLCNYGLPYSCTVVVLYFHTEFFFALNSVSAV